MPSSERSHTARLIATVFGIGFLRPGPGTYGSIAAVVVMLIWLSWTVNSMFFGAALATELEQADLTPYLSWTGLRQLAPSRESSES